MSKDKLSLSIPTDLSNPLDVLEVLKNAILRKPVNADEAKAALKQVLSDYEAQNRIFMIATANAEIERVVRLIAFIGMAEKELFDSKRIEDMADKDLMRVYALAQSNLMSGMDTIKKVADMRLEIMKASGGPEGIGKLFSNDKELTTLTNLPGLDSTGRDKVRKTVQGLLQAIEKDDSVTVNNDEDDEETEGAASSDDSED